MNTQELQIVGELYHRIQQWKEKYSTSWLTRSQSFKQFYQAVKFQQQTISLLFDCGIIPPLTIEEKVAQARYYVEDNIEYLIEYYIIEEQYFVITGKFSSVVVQFDEIPANSYFVGVVKL